MQHSPIIIHIFFSPFIYFLLNYVAKILFSRAIQNNYVGETGKNGAETTNKEKASNCHHDSWMPNY